MSEGTPSTPDEGSVHAVPSFAGREQPRTAKLQARHSAGAIVRKVRCDKSNSARRPTASQGQQGGFLTSGIGEAKTGRGFRSLAPFRFVASAPQLLREIDLGRVRGLGTGQIEIGARLPA